MSRALVLSPHPDDEAIGCGGTIRRHVLSGDSVRVIFLTSGEQGGHGLTPEETAKLREQEAARAGEILGVEYQEFWRAPDGQLCATDDLTVRLREIVSSWRPDWIYVTHSDEMHPDHQAANHLVLKTLASRGTDDVPLVRMYEVWTPLQRMDEIIDISEYIDDKLAAIRAHKSQCGVLRFDEASLALNRYRGEMHSWPGGDYAEVFSHMRA